MKNFTNEKPSYGNEEMESVFPSPIKTSNLQKKEIELVNLNQRMLESAVRKKFSESSDPHEYFKEQTYCYPIKDEEQSLLDKFFNEKLTGKDVIRREGVGILPTAKCSSFCNMICFFYFIIFGLVFLGIANNIREYTLRYDDFCKGKSYCVVDINLDTDYYAPIYLYYELDQFYSNYKTFSQSIQPSQLYGLNLNEKDQNTYCKGAIYNKEMPHLTLVTSSGSGFVIDPNAPANPCGLAAKYIFNDSFVMSQPSQNSSVFINQTGITFFVDAKFKFNPNDHFSFRQWLDMKNEHVMNWFAIQTLSTVRKLWGRIDVNLLKGKYQMIIYNQYPSEIFKGEKRFVLSTTSDFGGRNLYFGFTLLTFSALYMIGSFYIFFKKIHKSSGKKHRVRPENELEDVNQSNVEDPTLIRSHDKSMAGSKAHLKGE